MTLTFLLWFAPTVVVTSLISGVFGMAGGMILMATLVMLMPVSAAMVLHGVTQMTANGWRALLWRRYVYWGIVGRYVAGLVVAVAILGWLAYMPERGAVLIAVGALPFIALAIPPKLAPQADRPYGAQICGLLNGFVNLLAGVSGPILDIFFVRSNMDRRAVVATKAACQTLAHAAKLVYFGSFLGAWQASDLDTLLLASAVALAALGTSLSRWILERISDAGFRRWTRRIVLVIGAVCLVQGVLFYL